ncbi:L,D-transpeptidase [Brevifollis gellanilyticus]|uniref:L,D-TPase catalytic domain-containing protein n=1 Tax=Brevifollis gellanilyticus TaxID=748831 RepID=A0A512MEQ6_9BACT|nr:L,D-transpeptidase [Brevifollis gellanilyticus]GEP45203.1 hypothetical protein BGE01nite_44940 [Brevifollis gellanilyticus]
MKRSLITLLTLSLLNGAALADTMGKPSAHTQGTRTGKPSGPLSPGEYWWAPMVSPSGPVTVLVSIPEQMVHVYRNGVLIGRSTVSTGSKGHGTPAGVFSILEKRQRHYSSTYNNAPMPNMQRLTWQGIALHSGQIPGYPASHGCVRLPFDFSKLLFEVTDKGGTVIIGKDVKAQPQFAAKPGILLAPKDFTADMLRPLANNDYDWRPERATEGPVTILVSGADRTLYVYRNGTPIGRGPIEINGDEPLGGHVFTMLEGEAKKKSLFAPFRAARNWMTVATQNPEDSADFDDLAKRVRTNPEFATKIYDLITPGTTIVVTDETAVRNTPRDFTIIAAQ